MSKQNTKLIVLAGLYGAISGAGAQTISNDYLVVSGLTNATVTLEGRAELRISRDAASVVGNTIDLRSVDAWVFLSEVVPSAATTLLDQFRVNGMNAVAGSNLQLVQYGQGSVLIPHAAGYQPMTVYDGENFSGESALLSPYTAYGSVLNGWVSSFVLKRGYMATVSANSDGTGVSRNYVASNGDLRIGALPDGLNNRVRYVRIYPWRWVAKKGSCDIAPSELDAQWYYNWNVTSQPANSDYEYVAIKQQRWWPGLPDLNAAEYLGVNHVSGYNEPNNPVEDAYTSLNNGDVATAVGAWGELERTGLRIGAPAVTDGGYSWIVDFIQQAEAAGRRLDYIPIHYYRSSNNNPTDAANALRSFLKAVYDVAHKPIWVTEFNNGANWTGNAPTFEQNHACIEAMVNMMDETPWVERYSVYSAVEEVRQVYYNAGGYTPMGQMYRDHESPIGYQQLVPGEGMAASASYAFEGDLNDASGSGNHAVSKNFPDFTARQNGGTALAFNGVNDHVILPDSLSDGTDFTFAAWVYWNGGSNWQRIFDFGVVDSGSYMFLTPSTGSALRFTISNNGWGGEQRLNAASALPMNTWTHVAVTLSGNVGKLYVNGAQVDSQSVTLNPSDLDAAHHYLGRSMFPVDPYFDGALDDVLIRDTALSAAQIAALAAGNLPPTVTTNLVDGGMLAQGSDYSGTVVSVASDPDGSSVTYSKVYGADWLSVAADGMLSGTPGYSISGEQFFTIRATDSAGADDHFILTFEAPPYDFGSGPVAYWTFDDEAAANGALMPGNGERVDLDGDGAMDSDDFRIGARDGSGNGNHLTAWTSSWMKWSSDSMMGDFGMVYNNHWPAAGTDSTYNPYLSGIDAESITPAQWTIETRFKCYGANWDNNYQTIVGRDGYQVGGSSSPAAALYLSIRGTELAIEYVDVSGVSHSAVTSGLGLQYNQWYDVAAVSDGATLKLWVNGTIAALSELSSAGTALGLGYGTWSVARGMYNNGHVDRFNGVVDAVAVSGVALEPGSFVMETFGKSGYELYALEHGLPDALFAGDADSDGAANGLEYYLGSDMTNSTSPIKVLWWSADDQSVLHSYNAEASGVTRMVEWTTDLLANDWSSAGVDYTTNIFLGEIEAVLESGYTNQLFIRLRVDP
ncbi:MAG: hypothetical protein JXR40_04755 [Pontiellaceae bacterium]|nr:hypothetical protein [Pontiellaceae bacterium]